MRTLFTPVTVYGKPNCPACVRVVKKMEDAGVSFEYVDVSKNAEAYTYLTQVLKVQSVPVVIDDLHDPIIGYQIEALEVLLDYYSASETGL